MPPMDKDYTIAEAAPHPLPGTPPAIPEEAETLLHTLQSYAPETNTDLVRQAMQFAMTYHDGQMRADGRPYYYHPLAVASILADMRLDSSTIITALLHDTVEDTPATLEDIESGFGEVTRQLVDGVTKLSKIAYENKNELQAENFRKLVVATSEDIRVLIVKLADRLHNMRTLHYIAKPEKRQRIAKETLDIFAPLAERIGMQKLKQELQDIAFQELYPDAYQSVVGRLDYLRAQDTGMIERIAKELTALCKQGGMHAEVYGREKKPYSIWSKMQRQNIDFEQLCDIIAYRLIVESEAECYQALGVIHSAFHMVPDRFKDFISTPKENGYQSLHTVVMGPERQRIEIQIRTAQMHKIAEVGVAAHWSYKQHHDYTLDGKHYRWLRELLHILEHAYGADEVIANTRMEMYHDQVFCFTPRGDLIALPTNATPVDFAFAVHSEIGRTCVGAKINGRIVPLRTQLRNGDQVEILQSKSQQPSPAWQHFVVTGKARAEVRRAIRMQQRSEFSALGKEIMQKALLAEGLPQSLENLAEEKKQNALKQLRREALIDVFAAVGDGSLPRQQVIDVFFPSHRTSQKPSLLSRFGLSRAQKSQKKAEKETLAVPIKGLIPGMAIHYAGCCHPLPGEPIVGIVNTGKGVTIHTANCHELEQYVDSPERWLDVAWEDQSDANSFMARLKVILAHRPGSLATLTNGVAQGKANIYNLRITTRSESIFELIVDIEVHSVEHLNRLLALLRTKEGIESVERHDPGKKYD